MWGKPSRRQVLSLIGATVGGVAVSGRVTGDDATDATVYAVSEAGELVAFAAATGERRWGFEFAADPPSTAGPPLVWNGTVYLNGRGRLYAVDAATGGRSGRSRPTSRRSARRRSTTEPSTSTIISVAHP